MAVKVGWTPWRRRRVRAGVILARAPLWAPLVACALLLARPAAPALAGQYHVYSCRTPSGESAPADGWSASQAGVEAIAEDTCAQPGGALVAGLRAGAARTANSSTATWAFAAPAGETIAGATLWRAGDAEGGAAVNAFYEFWFAGPTNTNQPSVAFGQCVGGSTCPTAVGVIGQPLAPENRLAVPSASLGTNLYVNSACVGESGFNCREGEHDPNGYAAVVYLYAADLVLEQSAGPAAWNVGGELASASTVQGTSDVTFSASDPGSGVYEALFSVDGKLVQSSVVDENGGRCKDVGGTSDGLPAFLYAQPCAQSVSADVGFDTALVANGEHHLVVSVTDAAGNSATVLDRSVTVDNEPSPPPPGGPNGTNASAQAQLSAWWVGTRRPTLWRAFGRGGKVAGRLSAPGGAPIAGAQIRVMATPAYAGARTAAMTVVRTGAAGRFALRVPAGVSSRTLRLQYSANVGAQPVASRVLRLRVRAGVTLAIAPRVTSAGHSIRFSGRLRGGPVPAGGKPLVLEARSPGGAWLEFDVIRTDARGRFHASYRFKFPGPAAYQFRVLCEAEADYPFATGVSRAVGVFERG